MIKSKLVFSLFLAMMITVSKSEETKKTEVKKIERKEYYELLSKKNFLAAMAQAQNKMEEGKKKAQETLNKQQETLNKLKEAIQKKYNLKSEDIKETAEELNKKIEALYADLSYTDKGMVLCNNHWKKAAFITGAVVFLVGAYKYFSCEEDYANDEEKSEN